jgi:hypothetical protein
MADASHLERFHVLWESLSRSILLFYAIPDGKQLRFFPGVA